MFAIKTAEKALQESNSNRIEKLLARFNENRIISEIDQAIEEGCKEVIIFDCEDLNFYLDDMTNLNNSSFVSLLKENGYNVNFRQAGKGITLKISWAE